MIKITNFLVLIHDLKKGNKISCDYNRGKGCRKTVWKWMQKKCNSMIKMNQYSLPVSILLLVPFAFSGRVWVYNHYKFKNSLH